MKAKRLLAFGLAATMVLGVPVFADSTPHYVNSIGSVNMEDADNNVGKDETQGKFTEYYDNVDQNEDNAMVTNSSSSLQRTCSVYATQASTFSVIIPKTIILTGDVDKDNKGGYLVTVMGNIGADETINVVPDAIFKMSQQGKPDIDATVTQDITKFKVEKFSGTQTADMILGVDKVKDGTNIGTSTPGEVEVTNLTAGSWVGTFDFQINLTQDTPAPLHET